MENVKVLEIDKYEYGIIINALNEMRNSQKEKEAPTDAIEDIMLKVMDAPTKKRTFKLSKSQGTRYHGYGEAR